MAYDKNRNIVQFRIKPELQIKLDTIQNILHLGSESQTVRHLIETGLAFYELRQVEIARIKKKMKDYNIQVWELHAKKEAKSV